MSTKLVPWQRLSDLFDDSLFHSDSGAVNPPLDIVESEVGYTVQLDLPGVLAENVSVEFKEGRLWVAGERLAEPRKEGNKYHRLERRTGKFRRVVGLPEDVANDRIEADFRDGVLRISLPKAEASQPKKIEVKTR
jgi:HSP20 family protein